MKSFSLYLPFDTLVTVELPISCRLAISLFDKSVTLLRNLMYSFLISDILLDLVFPFISSISISVISSMICELVKTPFIFFAGKRSPALVRFREIFDFSFICYQLKLVDSFNHWNNIYIELEYGNDLI